MNTIYQQILNAEDQKLYSKKGYIFKPYCPQFTLTPVMAGTLLDENEWNCQRFEGLNSFKGVFGYSRKPASCS